MEDQIREFVANQVDNSVIPLLMDYIRIPNLSREYDPEWETNGLTESAMDLLLNWVKEQNIAGLTHEILKEPNKGPLLYMEVQGTNNNDKTVLMYGHMDKQPHFTGWREGTGPTTPAIIDGFLYGRGGADDGYALPGSVLSIKTLQNFGIPHSRIVILIESEEESGSPYLMDYVRALAPRIGTPSVIFCLDSGCQNYDQLWLTPSLRGVATCLLSVSVTTAGVHSGDASGIVAEGFRIIRILLDRLEDSETGRIKLPELYQEITPYNFAEAAAAAKILGDVVFNQYPFRPESLPVTQDKVESILNRTLRPTLCVVGASGFPEAKSAGNVLRPETTFKLSIRLPPKVTGEAAKEAILKELTRDPPYNAKVDVSHFVIGQGWEAPELQPWLYSAIQNSSQAYFGREALQMGEGGSIPFMGMLGAMFPQAQFVVTGLLGPGNNAHSSDENLNIDYLKKLLCCISFILKAVNEN